MAETTVVALYDNELALDRAVGDLGRAGLSDRIVATLMPQPAGRPTDGDLVEVLGEALRGEGPEEATFEDAGLSRDAAAFYAEAVRRGAGAVIVRADGDLDRIRGLLNAQAPAKLDVVTD